MAHQGAQQGRQGPCWTMSMSPRTIMKLFLLMAVFVCVTLFASINMVDIFNISYKIRHRFVVAMGDIVNSTEIGALHNNKSYQRFVDVVANKRHQLEHHVTVQHDTVHHETGTSYTETTRTDSGNRNNNSIVKILGIKQAVLKGNKEVTKEVNTNNILINQHGKVDIFGNFIGSKNKTRKSECYRCFEHNFKYMIQNDHICRQNTPNQRIFLLILITTTNKNINARIAIRKTWLTYSNNNTGSVRYAFLLGETPILQYRKLLEQENNQYHDIIKEDFVDSYLNLTYKTIMGYKWAATKCAVAEHVMKTDDDMYVNVPNVIRLVNGVNKSTLQTSILGACSQKASPIRSVNSKWFASRESYPDKFYPGFCSGTGYVTSMNVARKVYEISANVPFFHLEDVYVSLCMRKLGYHLKSTRGFNAGRVKLDPCIYKGNMMLTSHRLPPAILIALWKRQCRPQKAIRI